MLSPFFPTVRFISSGMFLTSTTASNSQTLARAFTNRSVPPASGRARSPCSLSTATASSTVFGATYANGCKSPLLSSVYSEYSSWQHWSNSKKTRCRVSIQQHHDDALMARALIMPAIRASSQLINVVLQRIFAMKSYRLTCILRLILECVFLC